MIKVLRANCKKHKENGRCSSLSKCSNKTKDGYCFEPEHCFAFQFKKVGEA